MKTLRRIAWRLGLAALAVNLALPGARAMFMRPEEVPVEQLLTTARAAVLREPGSAEARYTLARIHYLAFSRSSATVPAFRGTAGTKVRLAPTWMLEWVKSARRHRAEELVQQEMGLPAPPTGGVERREFELATRRHLRELERQDWQPPVIPLAERTAHAVAALNGFEHTLRLEPNGPLYLLGLASLIEEVVTWKQTERPKNLPSVLEELDLVRARETYLRAHRLAFEEDGKLSRRPTAGPPSLVSWEAGKAYLRLTEDPQSLADPAIVLTREEVTGHIENVEKLPMGAITPVVFSLRPGARIDDLLAPELSVGFDMRGFGAKERWPWVKRETGILVWDPTGRGEIVSGRQLFGGYTFEIFRATGYDALAALDGNEDGWLKGEELRGVRAWFDANGDGRSEPSEVRDLAALEIIAVAARQDGTDGPHPMNRRGLLRADGAELPTWDWMVEPRRN